MNEKPDPEKQKNYSVRIPIAGYAEFTGIEAKTDKEAIEIAWEKIHNSDKTPYDNYTWDYYANITTGNVTHVELNDEEAFEDD